MIKMFLFIAFGIFLAFGLNAHTIDQGPCKIYPMNAVEVGYDIRIVPKSYLEQMIKLGYVVCHRGSWKVPNTDWYRYVLMWGSV